MWGRSFAFSILVMRCTLPCCHVHSDFHIVFLVNVELCLLWRMCEEKLSLSLSVSTLACRSALCVFVSVYLCSFAACALGCSSCELVVTTSKAYSSSCNQEYNEVAVEEFFKPNGLKKQHTSIHSNTLYATISVLLVNSLYGKQ